MYLSAAEGIEDWLLHSAIQIEAGDEAGAIAGWLDECGAPAFAYPEITGYYLTCMAFISRTSPRAKGLARQRTDKVGQWLARSAAKPEPPPTRQYLHPEAVADWRNAAVFAFDIAMVVRGVTSACGLSSSVPWQALLGQHLAYLLGLCTPQDILLPAKLREGHLPQELPSTWSTEEGVHHVKTAAAILSVPATVLPLRLSAASQRLLGRWMGEPLQRLRVVPLHPLFYYIEGLIMRGVAESDTAKMLEAAAVYAWAMQHQDERGYLPPAPGAHGTTLRSDVVAQALRIGSLLRALGCLRSNEWDGRLEALARALLTFLGPDGGVSQYPLTDLPAPQWNAWCSMFAYQAFVYYENLVRRTASSAPDYYAELLI